MLSSIRRLTVCLAALPVLCLAAMASGSTNIKDNVREINLDNGMTLLLVDRPGEPSVAAGWVAHVGSANERPGITGISHLFEHMMFKGSPTIGVKDAKLDDEIRAQLDEIRGKMFEEEAKMRYDVRRGRLDSMLDPANATDRWRELKKEFDGLLKKQGENLNKNEFDKVYKSVGGTFLNAFTNEDMTVYFIRVPKEKMEVWFWMESERLLRPVFREFYSERDVVFEERRMRTDSTPTGKQEEMFEAMFWGSSPYTWPVVGWPSDISSITREQAQEYFNLYYAPNNLTVALVGDFNHDNIVEMAKKYFGRIPRGKVAPPDVVTLEMPQGGERVFRAEVDAPPETEIRFHTTAFNGDDDPALQVLQGILNGRTGRFYKRMILGDQIATRAQAQADARKYAGFFAVSATGKADETPEQLRDVLLEELDKVKQEGVTESELVKVKNSLRADSFRRLDNPFWFMVELLIIDGRDHWSVMDDYFARQMAVTSDDIKAVAAKYFVEDNRNVMLLSRKASAEPEDPAMASFSEEDKQQVQAMLRQFGQMPKDKLKEMLPRIESMLSQQVPADKKPVADYVIKKLHEKVGE